MLLLPGYFLGSFIAGPVASTAPAPPSCPESWSHAQDLGVICLKPKGESRHKQGRWQKIDNTTYASTPTQTSLTSSHPAVLEARVSVGPRPTGNITGASWVRDSALAFALPHSRRGERGEIEPGRRSWENVFLCREMSVYEGIFSSVLFTCSWAGRVIVGRDKDSRVKGGYILAPEACRPWYTSGAPPDSRMCAVLLMSY